MSYPSVPVNHPDPFSQFPGYISVPLSKISHITAGQNLGATGVTISAPQCTAPLVVTPTSSQTFTLPSAATLCDIFGTANQVQVNDVFAIPVLNLGSGAPTFTAGTGGSGSKTLAVYSAANTVYQLLVIQFTNNNPAGSLPSTATYTLL